MRTKRRATREWLLIYTAILMLAYAARALRIAYADLTFDEVATVYVAHRPPLQILRYLIDASREHPPLYYLGMSGWFGAAGTSEFAVRYPSVLIGVLTVAWGFGTGRKFFNREGGLWTGLLLAILPFSVWAGRNGRMYSLAILLALINLDLYRRMIQRPSRRLGVMFLLVTLAGAFTHYYLLLLWPTEGLILLLFPRKTRRIRRFWLTATLGAALFLAIFIGVSPGARATFLEVANRFPVRTFRYQELKRALMDIILYWHHPTLDGRFWGAVGLVLLGWALAWRRDRVTGVLLAAAVLVTVFIVSLIPAAIKARYLILIVPSLVLSLSACVTWLRPHGLRLILIILILLEINARWERLHFPPDTTFSSQIERLHHTSRPDDALVMNGPWPALLLTYYEPPEELSVYRVPAAAPPGFDAEVDIPRLESIVAQHKRIWVSYGAVDQADPSYGVSHWLAENMYCVERFHHLALYVPPPKETPIPVVESRTLASQLEISAVEIHRRTFTPGEFLTFRMTWYGPEISWRIRPTISLVDTYGQTWLEDSFTLGPVQKDEQEYLPSPWITQRGLRIQPGLPPGTYTLALEIESKGFPLNNDQQRSEQMPLTDITIERSGTSPDNVLVQPRIYLPLMSQAEGADDKTTFQDRSLDHAIPNSSQVQASFEDKLTLLGYQIEESKLVQGYPLALTLWWRADVAAPQAQLRVRLSHPTAPTRDYELDPEFYPITIWENGDIVKQMISYSIPRTLPPGTYHVKIQLEDERGNPLPISGSRNPLTFLEWIQGTPHRLDESWASIDFIQIKGVERRYRPPLFHRSADVRFGDVLRLRGYRIASTEVKAGETVELTEYWETQRAPDRIYAVFNHLKAADGTLIWQKDSWPRSGTYTTNFWVAGEVVAESYAIKIPPGTDEGTYTLYVGAYDPEDADTRLPAVDAQGERLLHDQVLLLTLQITR